jgi:hypothetical protein
MSEEQSPAAAGPAVPPKKGVSPARNAIGLVVLIAVLVVGVMQYMAMASFNSAINALNARMEVEDKDLMTQSEAEALIGKAPDDAGSDVQLGSATYTKRTYTWKALLKPYTLTAYYTKGNAPALHHTETEGAKYEPETNAAPAPSGISAKGGGPGRGMQKSGGGKKSRGTKGKGKAKAEAEGAPKDQSKPQADDKAKAGADEKAKGPEPRPVDKAKAGADEPPKLPE